MKKKIYTKKRLPIVVGLRPNTTVTGNHSNYIYVVSLGNGKNRRLPIVVWEAGQKVSKIEESTIKFWNRIL